MTRVPPVGTRVRLTRLYREATWLSEFLDALGTVIKISVEPCSGMRWVEVEFDGEGSPHHRTHGVFICNLTPATKIRRP